MRCEHCNGTGEVPEPRTLAERVVYLRKAARIERIDVEKGAGIGHANLWRIENGETLNPEIVTLVALADFFGVTVDYLVCRSNVLPATIAAAVRS